MKTTMKRTIAVLLAGLMIGSGGYANAASTNAIVNIQVTVTGACSFSQPSYALNVNAAVNTMPTGSIQILTTCSAGLSPSLQLASGLNYSGSGGYDDLVAKPYLDSSYTQAFTSTNLVADGSQQATTLYFQFPNYQYGTTANKPGTYNISVPLQINF
jgi:hypothetical protein